MELLIFLIDRCRLLLLFFLGRRRVLAEVQLHLLFFRVARQIILYDLCGVVSRLGGGWNRFVQGLCLYQHLIMVL